MTSSDESGPQRQPDEDVTRAVDWSRQWELPPEPPSPEPTSAPPPQQGQPPASEWGRPVGTQQWPSQPPQAPQWPPQPPQPLPPPPQPGWPVRPPERPRKRSPGQGTGGVVRGIVVAVVALLLAGGVTAAVVIAGTRTNLWPAPTPTAAPSRSPSPTAGSSPAHAVDIGSRATDPRPFTAALLFPRTTETVRGRGYRLLGSQPVANCSSAASGAASTALIQRGCSQVVRGTWQDTAGRYAVTVGLANLPTTVDAQQVITVLRDPSKGAFKPYPVPGTAAATFDGRSPTVVGWQAQGHYLIFSVAAPMGGGAASVSDPGIRQATADLRSLVSAALLRRAVAGR